MRSILPVWLALLSLAALLARGAHATEGRVALVIGNAAYKAQPLSNPVNDARAMAAALEQVGFQVARVENASHREMTRAVTGFGRRAADARVALFYYAGHGVQVRGRNFLVPVDADITSEASVISESVDVDNVLSQMAGNPGRLNLMILDACRNNPFEGRFRSAGGGLAAIDAPKGTLIAYATAPGRVAADGDRRNGLYTEHLLRAMQAPGLKVEELFKQVRIDVARATGDAQVPWEASSLTGDFYFRPPQQPATAPAIADAELQLWRRARDGGRPEHYREYLARYPQGEFAELAQARLVPPRPTVPQTTAPVLAPAAPVPARQPFPQSQLSPAPGGQPGSTAMLAALAARLPDIGLPGELRIVEPGADVPQHLRRFHGAWAGAWMGSRDHALVVETIEADGSVGVLYAWGDVAQANQRRGWTRNRGTIAGGTLQLATFANGARVRYAFDAAGALQGTYERGGQPLQATMARLAPPARAARLLVAAEIPHVPEGYRRAIADRYVGLAEPKALAIARDGEMGWAALDTAEESALRALQYCEMRSREGCVLYAVNLEVRAPAGTWQPERHVPQQLGRRFDPAQVPFARNAARDDLRRYWERRPSKALALTGSGVIGFFAGAANEADATAQALERCRSRAGIHVCFLYAVDDRVVFDADANRGKLRPRPGSD